MGNMGFVADEDKIECYVDFVDEGNSLFFFREKLHSLMSREISEIFEKYGFKYVILPLGEKGGGADTFLPLQILIAAWQNRGLIGAIISLVEIVFKIPKVLRTVLMKKNNVDAPRMVFSLGFSSKQEEIDYSFRFRLLNLKLISDEICTSIKRKYPIFKVDQSFNFFNYSLSFSVNYYIDAEHQNVFNTYRLNNLFKHTKIRKGTFVNYIFNKWFFIERDDGEMKQIYGGKGRTKRLEKKYFLLFSSMVLKDYFIF